MNAWNSMVDMAFNSSTQYAHTPQPAQWQSHGAPCGRFPCAEWRQWAEKQKSFNKMLGNTHKPREIIAKFRLFHPTEELKTSMAWKSLILTRERACPRAFLHACVCTAKFSLMTNTAPRCRGLVDRLFCVGMWRVRKLQVAENIAESESSPSCYLWRFSNVHLPIGYRL